MRKEAKFIGKTLDEAIEKANNFYNGKEFEYSIVSSIDTIFNNKIKISTKLMNNEDKKSISSIERKDVTYGYAYIKSGKLIVVDPKVGTEYARIKFNSNIKIKVNGEESYDSVMVQSSDDIDIKIPNLMGERKININISKDKLEAYLNVEYNDGIRYKLKDCNEKEKNNILNLDIEEDVVLPTKRYNKDEVIKQIKEMGIYTEIFEESIENVIEDNIENLLISRGKDKIDDEEDKIVEHYKNKKDKDKYSDRIDYKNIGYVEPVLKNQLVWEIIRGNKGKDGLDVFGNVIKHKIKQDKKLEIYENVYSIGDKYFASIDGKPYIQGKLVSIRNLHQIEGDVDMKTGNITFVGDVEILGDIKDGMKVTSQNDINVYKNLLSGEVSAGGSVHIGENVIDSKVVAGGGDIDKIKALKLLEQLQLSLKELYSAVEQIKKNTNKYKDGELIKILIENKFKGITSIILKLMNAYSPVNSKIYILFREKLIGIASVNIKNYVELNDILNEVNKEVTILKESIKSIKTVDIGYCQKSEIQSTGDIHIHGKGEYISHVFAKDKVIFTDDSSIARGGIIKADSEVRCGIVGNESGVPTKIVVGKQGHIYAKLAYINTCFVVGTREYLIYENCKDVHCFLDKDGDIVVERLVM
ncbi:Hypothetical protein CM240_1551 [Clostridium bornimense]|uniref:Flagellar Assembly Protein A N-terminal region domain-containing protein n=1 Tax=Clostridium bornimense TaxID=1216932 RepID=W6RYL0_9CLOT|nr:flagellar assembly protein A [Clostridium bornimense]CDM68709.1 Hypothetical protein CM240_1551 [Clostridium bornimense]